MAQQTSLNGHRNQPSKAFISCNHSPKVCRLLLWGVLLCRSSTLTHLRWVQDVVHAFLKSASILVMSIEFAVVAICYVLFVPCVCPVGAHLMLLSTAAGGGCVTPQSLCVHTHVAQHSRWHGGVQVSSGGLAADRATQLCDSRDVLVTAGDAPA